MHDPDDEDSADEARISSSLAALAVVLFLIVASVYVMQVLKKASDIEDCVLSGHRDCPLFQP